MKQEIIEKIQSLMDSGPVIIGIGGVSCSGKSTFSMEMKEALGARNVDILPVDCYYKDYETRRSLGVTGAHPDSICLELLREHLCLLRNGESIETPAKYSREVGGFIKRVIDPSKVIIVEGLFSLHGDLLNQYDLSIFIDCPEDLQLERHKQRDVIKVHRGSEDIEKMFVKRNLEFNEFLRPHAANSHVKLFSTNEGWTILENC